MKAETSVQKRRSQRGPDLNRANENGQNRGHEIVIGHVTDGPDLETDGHDLETDDPVREIKRKRPGDREVEAQFVSVAAPDLGLTLGHSDEVPGHAGHDHVIVARIRADPACPTIRGAKSRGQGQSRNLQPTNRENQRQTRRKKKLS